MNNTLRILLALLFSCLSLPALAALNAWLDHDQIAPGETVQLTLQYEGQTDSQPDLSPLKQEFEIVGRSSGSNIQIVNGKMNSKVQVNLMLLPKHDGKLVIPALQWNGQSSAPLTLNVSASGAANPSASPTAGNVSHVFITATPEQKQPYVQAAVALTVRLYTDQPLYQASLDFQPGTDVQFQQIGQDKQSNETRNGRSYQVIERKYLLFPQRSGKIQLDGPVLNAQVQDTNANANDPFGNIFGRNPFAGMLNATKPIRVKGETIVLNVRPRPASATSRDWLPAQKMTLEESWQPDNAPIHAGDPVTRHFKLQAAGLTAAQLPDLGQLVQLPAGLRAYPDQPKLNNDAGGNSVIGTREQDIAIIANLPGHYEIPALHLWWWDTAKNAQQEIVLPARTLEVLPAAGGIAISTAAPTDDSGSGNTAVAIAPQPAAENPPENNRWRWISLAFASLWLGTLAAWWFASRRKPVVKPKPATSQAEPRLSEARKAFQQACRDNDAQSARRHLLVWAKAVWPQNPPGGLNALSARTEDAAIKTALSRLDRACFNNEPWQGAALLNLKSLGDATKPNTLSGLELAGLYA